MKKKILVICILLIALIWLNSCVQGDASTAFSQYITEILVNLFSIEADFLSVHVFIRKAAHFIEYALLGGISCVALTNVFKNKGIVFSLFLCTLIAGADETIQYFTPNRNGQVSDVVLDVIGAAFGILFVMIIKKILERIKK